MNRYLSGLGILLMACLISQTTHAQAPGQPQGPVVVSPDVAADGRVSFRIYAPQAQSVRLIATDIPQALTGVALSKNEAGVWEAIVGPIVPGSFRYRFNVDSVLTMDPRNPATSESNANSWSLVHVPGASVADTQNVPHGSVAEVTYYSASLKAFRRMHVYTPPGYETGSRKYPVFYLLHGAGDSDDSWSTVGRAGFIIDNLISGQKARPMIVVMPAGHVRGQAPAVVPTPGAVDPFVSDFLTDIVPYVGKHYRVSSGREHTAIAGLSMGGGQTLDIVLGQPERFAYVGVFSSGLFGLFPVQGRGAPPPAPAMAVADWETRHAGTLGNASAKKGLKLFWFSTGKDDFLVKNTEATVALFRKHGFAPVYQESAGGHTWINWRAYLEEFSTQLFQ